MQLHKPMGLRGKTILVTRQHEQAEELVAVLTERGAMAVVIPMIHIAEPESWQAFDTAVAHSERYDALAFSSTNAVAMFVGRLRQLRQDIRVWSGKRIYAVGEKTRQALESFGLPVERIPNSYSAEALAAELQSLDVKGQHFLIPQGNLAKDVLVAALRRMGAAVDTVEVYRNVPPKQSVLDDVRRRVQNHEFDIVMFASPSAAENFARAVSPAMLGRGETKVAVIGPTTRAAAERLGFRVDIEARTSTWAGLADAIEAYFAERDFC